METTQSPRYFLLMDAHKYKCEPLDLTKPSLRLLKLKKGTGEWIQCELVTTTLGNKELPYEAVSYTWGGDSKVTTIDIDGERLLINFNLYLILRDLRSPKTVRTLWVDAICINQHNELEKGHQVQQMRDVFGYADRVLFCICRPTELTDLLMVSLKKLEKRLRCYDLTENSIQTSWNEAQLELADNGLNLGPEQIKGLEFIQRQGLKYILEQNWVLRVWILQEVANARNALIYCGSKYVSAVIFVTGTKPIGQPVGDDTNPKLQKVREVLNLMQRP